MRRTLFSNFFILALLIAMTVPVSAQQVDGKLPWSVRMTESEMIRLPGILATRFPTEIEVGLLPRTGIGSYA